MKIKSRWFIENKTRIIKDNKLLAEYLGRKVKEFKWKDETFLIPNDSDPIVDVDIAFWSPNSNWNQLMAVVEKIEEDTDVWIDILFVSCHIYKVIDIPLIIGIGDTKIKAVYAACIGYIKTRKP